RPGGGEHQGFPSCGTYALCRVSSYRSRFDYQRRGRGAYLAPHPLTLPSPRRGRGQDEGADRPTAQPGHGRFRTALLGPAGRVLAVLQGGGGQILNLEHPSSKVIAFHHDSVHSVAASPDGRWVATACWGGPGIKIWDARGGQLVRHLLPDV